MPETVWRDERGNTYWQERDKNTKKKWLVLRLSEQPKSGKQIRRIGYYHQGILCIRRPSHHWMRVYAAWFVNVYAMEHFKALGFNLVSIEYSMSGQSHKGFFYPQLITRKGEDAIYRADTYELQKKLEYHEVKSTPADAKKYLEQLKSVEQRVKEYKKEPPQRKLF